MYCCGLSPLNVWGPWWDCGWRRRVDCPHIQALHRGLAYTLAGVDTEVGFAVGAAVGVVVGVAVGTEAGQAVVVEADVAVGTEVG